MPVRIDSWNPAWDSRILEWVEQWTAIGLSTEPADFSKAETGVRGCYIAAGLQPPRIILRMGSPLGAILGGIAYIIGVRNQVWNQVWSQVRSQVWSQVESQVRSQVYSAWSQYRGGNLWASWYAYISFLRDVCLWECPALADFAHDELHARNASWCWYHDKVAAISDRPEQLHRNTTGSLHCDGGPSITWRDGWKLWHLNGVPVEPWLAETRAEDIDPRKIADIANAEVRREFVRKIGLERIAYKCQAETLDTMGDYALLRIDVGQGRKWTYLKMLNPSIGLWHVEGVPLECRTVEEALHFRKPESLRQLPIDDHAGADWYQQGDVCMWPRKAKAVKRYPKVLT